MAKILKFIAWLVLLILVGWIAFSIYRGNSSVTGNVVLVPSTGNEAEVLSFPDCIDTDKGKNYRELGHTYNVQENIVYDDYCDGEELVEYFCTNKYPDRINIPCDCFKGACR